MAIENPLKPSRPYPRFPRLLALREHQQGKAGWILLWLVGVPLPILLVLYLLRGCT